MTYVFLPYEDRIWLHKMVGLIPKPIALSPGDESAKYFFSTDGASFAFLDQNNKRIGLYKVLDQDPWYEKMMSPINLFKNCHADCLLIHNEVIYVGGYSKKGECIWRKNATDISWITIPLPENITIKRNKSVDLLFIDENRLIAVDNIVLPKWIFTYDISNSQEAIHIKTYDLEQHTSYESVRQGADNEHYIALVSVGINHCVSAQFLSILDKGKLEEIWVWSKNISQEQIIDEFDPLSFTKHSTVSKLLNIFLYSEIFDFKYFEKTLELFSNFCLRFNLKYSYQEINEDNSLIEWSADKIAGFQEVVEEFKKIMAKDKDKDKDNSRELPTGYIFSNYSDPTPKKRQSRPK